LVEQQQLWLHRDGDREFERALLAMRQLGGRTAARSASPTCASAASAGVLSPASSAALPKKRKLEPCRACTASATFSSTEKRGRIDVIWNERARPRSARM